MTVTGRLLLLIQVPIRFTLYWTKKQTDVNGNKLYADKSEFDKITTFLNSKLGIDKTLITQQLNNKKASQVQFGTKGSNISLQKNARIAKSSR
ncbi:hypothetical protein [Lactococcus fujiensis]|uniref:hypothetical protein n=1 Tax=Lactococcus fujiensis TaxID=610251 RepID=UPI0020920E1C|nr:hypothetical protein [Lactococcus fujiensis]